MVDRARNKITSLSSTERNRRDVEDRDEVHSVLLTRNDPQQIDGCSQSNREVILLRALSVVVGIGNPYRGDDAVGWAVIDGLKKKTQTIQLVKSQGDIAELIDIFSSYRVVILVDACQMNAPVGTWQRIDAHKQKIVEISPLTSTHGLSVTQAIALAKNISVLPPTLVLYVINGKNFSMNDGLSPAVAKSVEEVIQALLEEIRLCTNTVSSITSSVRS